MERLPGPLCVPGPTVRGSGRICKIPSFVPGLDLMGRTKGKLEADVYTAPPPVTPTRPHGIHPPEFNSVRPIFIVLMP